MTEELTILIDGGGDLWVFRHGDRWWSLIGDWAYLGDPGLAELIPDGGGAASAYPGFNEGVEAIIRAYGIQRDIPVPDDLTPDAVARYLLQ